MSQQQVPGPEQAAGEQPASTPQPEPVLVRRVRHPKYSVFIGTGVAIGVVVGLLLLWRAGDAGAQYSWRVRLGYLCTIFGLLGGVLGATVAVIVDRPRKR